MSKDIQVSTSQKGDIAIISIKGDVTAVTGEVIGNAYHDVLISTAPKILLQFDKDCYINSGGLASLIDIASEGRKKAQKIHAYGLSDHFQKIFQMVGLTRCIPVFTTEEAAMSDF
ncbi:MAG: STAS domain-containing protein [Deltaproteobacteria bacterium]|jgi:anti-sigma B factor antagonist|nr:STAS domain-containing protein [Deltaproteobacteria bacterium]